MTDNSKKNDLINNWILNELAILQQNYFHYLEKKEINFATAQLIKFTREKLSNEYLELVKISPWDENTQKTLLFIYQQLLIMLHPAIPFITEHIYQEITQQKILTEKITLITTKFKKNEFWQIDCLLLLINNIRSFSQGSKISEFYLELVPEWENKFNNSFDFNNYLRPLTKSEVFILEKEKKGKFSSFVDLQPFGILWYQEQVSKIELEKQLKFYEKEYARSRKLLENDSFRRKAPIQLVAEEEKKLIYYEEQKKKIQTELKKIKDN
ncbi:MAG: class I tRNA ligase family protein [Candidatus Moeniiplasma glomeromycotorum]|nr:class I tRNA ligase family protein [Candidatus Moeniiplasma glomeromycotorum]